MAGCFRSKPPTFEQAAVPQRCHGVEAPFQLVASTLIQPADVACSERYSTLLECAGKTWLLRRVEMRLGNQNSVNSDTWQTVLRTKGSHGTEDGFTPSHVTLTNTLNMSHNAAFLCDDGKIVAWGGRRKAAFPRKPYEERGIYRAVGTPMGRTIQWSRPQLVLDGSRSSGCTELRAAVGMTCEFDGKLSVTRHGGRVLLFARANLGRCGGHRAVQVTSSADGVLGWTRWRTLQIDGVSEEDSIYFAAVRQSSARSDAGTAPSLVAHMPAILGGEGGVYRSESEDGHRWSKPVLLMRAEVFPEDRTADYPVDGEHRAASPGAEALFVEHGVQLAHGAPLQHCQSRPFLCKYEYRDATRLPAQGSQSAYNFLLSAPPPTRPAGCPEAPGEASLKRHAVVLRGQIYRWGCSDSARRHQLAASRSYVRYAESLERAGSACVDFFLVMISPPCAPSTLAELTSLYSTRLKAVVTVNATASQADGMRAAVELYEQRGGAAHDSVTFARHDVALLRPAAMEACGRHEKIGIASRCEASAWRSYRCVNDVLFVVPRARLRGFFAAVGSSSGANPHHVQCGCFDASCAAARLSPALARSFRAGSGHDCYNVLANFVGESALEFCWPDVQAMIREPNPYYEVIRCEDVDDGAAYKRRACAKRRGPDVKASSLPPKFKRKEGSSQLQTHLQTRSWEGQRLDGAPAATVALCLCGQLRVIVRMRLHHLLQSHVVNQLHADVFLHVDAKDTRQWGATHDVTSDDYDEVRRVLRPKLAHLESYLPAGGGGSCDAELRIANGTSRRGAERSRLCYASDCGSFRCGCYLPGCTHCDVRRYVPQHAHNAGCFRLALLYEARAHVRYQFFVKARPDLAVYNDFPSITEISNRLTEATRLMDVPAQSPAICTLGKHASKLAGGKPLDDKFALMDRRVAMIYFNATAAFQSCALLSVNSQICAPKESFKGAQSSGQPTSYFAKMQKMQAKRKARSLAQSAMSSHSPYWATPQCVLTKHMLTWLPDLLVVPCAAGTSIRLVRP